MSRTFRVVIFVIVLISLQLIPMATSQVAQASVSLTEPTSVPWGSSANPNFYQSPTGEMHALWLGDGQLWHSRQAGGVWFASVRIAEADDFTFRGAKFAPDGEFDVVFSAWLKGLYPKGSEIYFAHWTLAEGWSLPELVSRTESSTDYSAALFVAKDGVRHAAWVAKSLGSGEQWVRYGRFVPVEASSAQVLGPASPMIAESNIVTLGHYGSWTSGDIPGGRGQGPHLCVDEGGWQVFVAWEDRGEVFLAAKLLWLVPGEQWRSAFNVSVSLAEDSALVKLVCNPRGWEGVGVYWKEVGAGSYWASIWFDDLGRASMTERRRLHEIFLPGVRKS